MLVRNSMDSLARKGGGRPPRGSLPRVTFSTDTLNVRCRLDRGSRYSTFTVKLMVNDGDPLDVAPVTVAVYVPVDGGVGVGLGLGPLLPPPHPAVAIDRAKARTAMAVIPRRGLP